MKKFCYIKNERYAEGDDFTNIKDFIVAVRLALIDGQPVITILEPGDGTHYEFLILMDDAYFYISKLETNTWALKLSHNFTHVGYIAEKMDRKGNEWMAYLVAELSNNIKNSTYGNPFFDWEKAQPVTE